jgi:hypothetical protein
MTGTVKGDPTSATRGADDLEIGLLVALVLLLPIEQRLGALPGPGPLPSVSVPWVVFAVMASVALLRRRSDLPAMARERALLFAASLFVVALVMEVVHPATDLSDPIRIGQAAAGAALIAMFCRDDRAMRFTLGATIVSGVGTSLVIIGFTYAEWRGSEDLSFNEVTAVRDQVWDPGPLLLDLHYAPFIAVLGAVAAFALSLGAIRRRDRLLLLLAAAICFLGAVMTTSRAAIAASLLASAVILACERGRRVRGAAALLGVLVAVVAVAPNVVFDRLEISSTDTRTRLAEATVDEAGDYLPFGVGGGHYEKTWASEHGFVRRSTGQVQGTHNSFVQVTVFWGLGALVALTGIVVEAWRSLRRSTLGPPQRTALWAMATAALVYLVFSHTLYDKTFVLVLGLSLAAGHWFAHPPPERSPR